MSEAAHIDDSLLRELMRSISHDLRNPLAAVVTNLAFSRGLIDEPGVGDRSALEDLTEAVDDSVIACDVMQMLVANLDIVLKQLGARPTLHSVTVGAVVKDVVKRFRPRASQARVSIALLDRSDDIQALLDRTYFALALENLVANAVTHTPKNTTVDVEVVTTDDSIDVHILDAGIIIPEALRTQAVSAHAHTRDGKQEETRYSRGLGLLCAQRAASFGGATLELSHRESKNLFSLHVPLYSWTRK